MVLASITRTYSWPCDRGKGEAQTSIHGISIPISEAGGVEKTGGIPWCFGILKSSLNPVKHIHVPEALAKLMPHNGLVAMTEDMEFTSLWRWVRLSVLVGVVVGLAATGVSRALHWSEHSLLFQLVEHGIWWALLIVPAAGGLLAGLITWRFAPEAAGAGTGEVVDSFHNHGGHIRRRVPLVKLVATMFTLGSGGSAGKEGPMAQIGAGFGSYLAKVMGLSVRERRLLLLAGAAGGISALLQTPLGAALWSLEVLYHHDFESDGMFPCLVSSVTAYSVATLIADQGSLFSIDVAYNFHPLQRNCSPPIRLLPQEVATVIS